MKIKKGFYWFEWNNGTTCTVEYFEGTSDEVIFMSNYGNDLSKYDYKKSIQGSLKSYYKQKLESGEGIYLGE